MRGQLAFVSMSLQLLMRLILNDATIRIRPPGLMALFLAFLRQRFA
jgi:hypothetical protein